MTGHFIISILLLGLCLGMVFLLSAMLTYLVRQYALHKAILDIPNERSSHLHPTPRGGGIGIVFTFMLSLFILGWARVIETQLLIALTGGALIALIGYWDDVYSMKAGLRFFIHFVAASWGVFWLHGFAHLDLGPWQISLSWSGDALAVIGVMWCINLYNFMDGIDGLAGTQGVFVGLGSSLILWSLGAAHLSLLLGLLSASITGFMIWNWPPAKIFLGDVGSGFLGYVFAIFSLYSINQHLLPLAFWWALLSIFIYDATFTLISRIIHRKPWYLAHREHAYQCLIALGASHRSVTTAALLINLFFLLPIACAMLIWPQQSLWLLAGSSTILWLVWLKIKMIKVS